MSEARLPPAPIFIDLTELTTHPLRTGIQRVEREILRRWRGPRPLVPCRFDAEKLRFCALPDAVVEILTQDGNHTVDDDKERLRTHLEKGTPISQGDIDAGLHNPEVFYEQRRAEAYRALCRDGTASVSWLVYDFLPFLHPQGWEPRTTERLMHYVRTLREIPRAAFISEQTRNDYLHRVIRDAGRAGPVIPLGGDGVALSRQEFDPRRRMFTYVGTIEPRKNVADILEAFEMLWRQDVDVELTVIGRMEIRSTREPPILDRLKAEPRFSYLGHASDDAIRQALQRTRATLFVSSLEGFGIPPYESLASGIPVVASANLPSLDLLPAGGRVILGEISPTAIAGAVLQLLDDSFAERLWGEVTSLRIPTWDGFVQGLARWLHD
ncbi:glycosyltransferase [Mesorhizobium sp. GbtcB19]|uniref:glycosyltransferase n=1 Tax=Mesorhizobium sp. GbtcB19 TaxID=2824764 RepID=UPI001C301490|nr:glycosyltransferase [Mesorhizobium sp. GbtcB19]